ncbi:acyl carrier protein [Pleurocapsales cyanobacterium LEGE 06147]|nr:acyl carrier protein [Pleurocapsales cyanobacterium LEGE 06147]
MNIVKSMNTLKEILRELGISPEFIQPNSLLYQDLQLDSTEIVEISLALKRKLGIKVKLETRQDKTLAEVCSLIESAMSKKVGEIS